MQLQERKARSPVQVCQARFFFLHQITFYLEVPANGQIILFSTSQGLSCRRTPTVVGCLL